MKISIILRFKNDHSFILAIKITYKDVIYPQQFKKKEIIKI